MSLPNFIAGLSNPLDDKQNISQLLDEFVHGIAYESLIDIYRNDKVSGKIDQREIDKYYSSIFNEWKNSIVSIPKDRVLDMASRIGNGFKLLYEFLKKQPDLYTKNGVDEVLYNRKNEEMNEVLDLLNPFKRSRTSWTYITNNYVDIKDFKGFEIQHRIYLNIDSDKVFKVANLLREKCKELNIAYEFKFDDMADRADSMVIYCSDDNLLIFVKLLELIKRENKDLTNAFHRPPVATGVYKGWIGYGEEPSKDRTSYNVERAPVIRQGIGIAYGEWAVDIPKHNIRVGDKTMTYLDYLAYQLYKNFMEHQRDVYILGGSSRKATSEEVKMYNSKEYRNNVYSLIKRFVYDNKVSLTTLNNDQFNVMIPTIVGRDKKINQWDCEDVIRWLYKAHVMANPKLMDRLRVCLKTAMKDNDISTRVVVESSTMKELQEYQEQRKKVHKVVYSRPMDRKIAIKNMYETLEKAFNLSMKMKNQNIDLSQMLDPMIQSFQNAYNCYQHRFSGSSEDYDERSIYYMKHMCLALKEGNIHHYNHYKSLMLAYEEIERRDKSL